MFLVCLFSITSISAQITFQKGYFINNQNSRTECLIKNLDWKNNPTKFDYRLSSDGEIEKLTIEDIKEFGVYNESKYIRADVKADLSSTELNSLNFSNNSNFENKTLFLKVLIEGDANLYYYEENQVFKFFYSTTENPNIEQLIFKITRTSNDLLKEKHQYRQQLMASLKCFSIKESEFKNIKYYKQDLFELFKNYNICKKSDYKIFENKANRTTKLHLNIRAGVSNNSFNYITSNTLRNNDFGSQFSPRIGLEIEMPLNFNNGKWAILMETTYQSFKKENDIIPSVNPIDVSVNYNYVELALGARHYMFLNNNSKIFFNISYVMDIVNNSSIVFSTNTRDELPKDNVIGLGVGYRYKKFQIEYRYHTKKFEASLFDYQNIGSLILGYQIF